MEQFSFGGMFGVAPTRRLYFGIWPDDRAADRLTRLTRQLGDGGTLSGRPVETHRLHLSLHHLGDFADQMPPGLLSAAMATAETVKMAPFEVVFDRIGSMRGMVLLRASDGSRQLKAFWSTLRIALVRAGLGRHVSKTFSPHVTLAYKSIDFPERPVEPMGWTVREFVLVESLIGGRRHTVQGRWAIEA